MKIVMISGKMGSGKTTTAKALGDMWFDSRDRGVTHYRKFADTLYGLHNDLLDRFERITGEPRVKKDGVLLQLLGTEWGRKVHGENVWVDILRKDILKYGDDFFRHDLIIIDDCRFENEFDAFPEALRVRLLADESVRKSRCDSWRDNTNHPSETGLDAYEESGEFDLYIDTGRPDSTPEHAATLILAQLKKNNWKEKRR